MRQDELTSLETEAQVARSDEVLGAVHNAVPRGLHRDHAAQRRVLVPANTQILEISFTAANPENAQTITNAVAAQYLANRAQRHRLNNARITRVEPAPRRPAVKEHTGGQGRHKSAGERLYEQEMADALRNELVSLRAQRTALENSESPSGSVIAPAVEGKSSAGLTATVLPFGFARSAWPSDAWSPGCSSGPWRGPVRERRRGARPPAWRPYRPADGVTGYDVPRRPRPVDPPSVARAARRGPRTHTRVIARDPGRETAGRTAPRP